MKAILLMAQRLLAIPTGDGSRLEALRAVNLGTAIFLGITVLASYGVLYAVLGESVCALICFIGSALCTAAALLYRITRSIPLVREALLNVIYVLLLCLSYRLGGVRSPTLIWLVVCPTIAALVGGTTGRVWTVLALIAVGGFYALPLAGIQLPPIQLSDANLDLLIAVSAVSLSATVAVFALLFEATNRAAFRQAKKLATVDELTSLPNRRFMKEALEAEDRRGTNVQKGFSVALIDIDHFKQINDSYGHDVGDEVLRQFSARASSSLRTHDILSRWGGEEFLLLMPNTDARSAATVVNRLREDVMQLPIDGGPIHLTFSAGVADASPGAGVGEVIKQCDLALGLAKSEGRNAVKVFDNGLQAEVTRSKVLRNDISRGIEGGEFVIHYQPQYDVHRDLVGAEALLRWNHPRLGLLSPTEFISIAEQDQHILLLGEHVLTQACEELASWAKNNDTKDLSLSVNVSARQLRAPEFLGQVISVVTATGADPTRLKLELTESILLGVTPTTLRTLSGLRELGLRLSLDDFGTGYSSLNYLKRLSLDELKIDRAFIRNIVTDPKDRAIAETILALGRALGLCIIAEGVETEDQRDILVAAGCQGFQGYLYGRAMPSEDFKRLASQPAIPRNSVFNTLP